MGLSAADSPMFYVVISLVVQHGGDRGIVDVGLIEPLEAGVDVLLELLALHRLDRSFDALVADADRILGDGARFETGADGVLLLLARVVADDGQLAVHVQFLRGIQHADDGTFIRAEVALEVGVRADDGLGDVGGLELIAAAILGVDDGDVRVLGLDLIGETLDAIDAGAADYMTKPFDFSQLMNTIQKWV